jgi:hypothetical protein
MPYTTEFLEGGAGILHVGHGRVALADVLAWTGEGFRAVERGKPIEFALIDLTAVTEFPMHADEIRPVALVDERLAQLNPKVWVAVVAPQDHIFGLARMWQAYTDHHPGWISRVFRLRSEADDWLRAERGKALRPGLEPGTPS